MVKRRINLHPFEGGSTFTTLDIDIPDLCLRNGEHMTPDVLYGAADRDKQNFSVLLRCVDCGLFFNRQYKLINRGDGNFTNYRVGTEIDLPIAPKIATNVPDSIKKISSDFDKIYNQAMQAESYQLDQIVGIGLRKALEFLVKDYAVKQNTAKADKIKSDTLQNVINDSFKDDPRIQSLATGAAYLGNDETHYVKRYETKDLKDLKRFINSFISIIDMNETIDETLRMRAEGK
ncbi:MAG: DUF4145 domain-containing protein [Oenococcus oeni]